MSSTPSTRRAHSAGCGRTPCRTTSSGRSSTPRSGGRRAATTSTGVGSWSPTRRSRSRSRVVPGGVELAAPRPADAAAAGRRPGHRQAAIARRPRPGGGPQGPELPSRRAPGGNIGRAPVWVFAIVEDVEGTPTVVHGANIFGAVQNLMLAARAHGLGSTLTMLHRQHEAEVAACSACLAMPGRWPDPDRLPGVRAASSGPSRRPVETVVYWDRWGGHGTGRRSSPSTTVAGVAIR